MAWTYRYAASAKLQAAIVARAELAAIETDPYPVDVVFGRPLKDPQRRHVWLAAIRQADPPEPSGLTGVGQPQPYTDTWDLSIVFCAAVPGRSPDEAAQDCSTLLAGIVAAVAASKSIGVGDPTLDGVLALRLERINGPDVQPGPQGPQAWGQVVVQVETRLS